MRNKCTFIIATLLAIMLATNSFGQKSNFSILKTIQTKGKIYSELLITSDTTVVLGCHGKYVYFLDKIGNLISKFKTNGWVHASPSELSDGRIAIGCYDKNIYFFDRIGNLINKIKPGGRIFSKIEQFADGTLVFGTNKKKIQFISPNGKNYAFKTKKMAHGGITIFKNQLIAGTHNKQILVLNKEGELQKSISTKRMVVHSKPAILQNGMLAVGSYDKNLYIFNADNDSIIKTKAKGRIHSSPIQLADGTIVFGSMDKNIYLLNQEGIIKHKIKTKGWIVSSPQPLSDSTFCIGSYDNNLYVISTTGRILDKFDTGGKIFSTPAILPNNTIVVASNNKKVYYLKYQDTLGSLKADNVTNENISDCNISY